VVSIELIFPNNHLAFELGIAFISGFCSLFASVSIAPSSTNRNILGKNKSSKAPELRFDELGGGMDLEQSEIEIKARFKDNIRREKEGENAKLRPKWMVSNAIGGRMINADPVFTQDEK